MKRAYFLLHVAAIPLYLLLTYLALAGLPLGFEQLELAASLGAHAGAGFLLIAVVTKVLSQRSTRGAITCAAQVIIPPELREKPYGRENSNVSDSESQYLLFAMSTTSDESESPTRPGPQGERGLARLAELSPAYFGMVMATGIVSLAAYLMNMPVVAEALFLLNCVVYAVLWILTLLRIVRYPRQVLGDLIDHLRGPGFFTIVAGTCVLGSQFVLLASGYRVAMVLWVVAVVLWIGLTYTIFTGFTIKEHKPPLQQGISGAWLLAVVATQSIAVLAALLAVHVGQPGRLELNFLALSMWLWGGMLYIWMMSLIFYRYTFFRFSPDDLSPPYWINMGAMAISTLAGSLLILNSHHAPFLLSLQPFIKGFTVFYWATGTWWIPMLLLLGAWRYGYRRFPLKYDPLYWGAVFPLGMYTTSTHQMIEAMGFEFLGFLPRLFVYIALAAWAAVFAGLVRYLLRHAKGFRF